MNNPEDKIKHLQMIQDVVKRMADTSAAMKRYALVAFVASAALARAMKEPDALLLVMAVVFIFWALDAQYLRQEKWFRDMFDDARVKDETDFNLTPPAGIIAKTGIGYGFGSWSTLWLYLPLLAIAAGLWLFFKYSTTTGGC